MNTLFKLIGIPYKPARAEGYTINYRIESFKCNHPGCGSRTYAVRESRYAVYCPMCQRVMLTVVPTY